MLNGGKELTRKRVRIIFALLVVLLLTGCSSTEKQAVKGMENAKIVFQDDAEETNEKVNDVNIFLPRGFAIEEQSDETNILLSKGKDSYILFINPNELPSSHLYYDLMVADTNIKIVEKSTFEQNGRFGFAAVIENSVEKFELITSIGGIKLTTISEQADIANNLDNMMMIVRSISVK